MPKVRLNAAKSGYDVISDRFEIRVAWFVFLRDAVNYASEYADGGLVIYDAKVQDDIDFLYKPELETIGAA